MKIINATWEKRNLGTDAYEILLSNEDCINSEQVFIELSKEKYQKSYVVIKMPIMQIKMLHELENIGFRFMESQLCMVKQLGVYNQSEKNILRDIDITQREIDKNLSDWKNIVGLIDVGMFYTDRIYLDPQFDATVSCERYKNWIMDLVDKPNYHMFVYCNATDIIGFGVVMFDYENKKVQTVLEGIFKKYQHLGYGKKMLLLALDSYKKKGFLYQETTISSNNIPIMKLDAFFGYKVFKETYVLRKY